MIALAIETSATPGSVALASERDGARVVDCAPLLRSAGHARALAPAIQELLSARSLSPSQLDVVVAGMGPGGYTGIRLALATAKTLAAILPCPIVGVPSTSVLAAHASVPVGDVLTVLDAKKGDVYGARYKRVEGVAEPTVVEPPFVGPAQEVVATLRPGTFVCGDGFGVLAEVHDGPLQGDASLVPRAEELLSIGVERFLQGRTDEEKALLPLYLRPSEAERRWEERRREREGRSG